MENEKDFLDIEARIVKVLKNIYDPEIPVNIYDLGLIYEINAEEDNIVHITMTLTAPNCPMADYLVSEVDQKVKEIEGVKDLDLKLTFDPPWDKSMLSEEAALALGLL
jgi:FeS assembly SUF system protein